MGRKRGERERSGPLAMAGRSPGSERRCAGCDTPASRAARPLYAFGTEGILCMDCARKRAGVYDETQRRWTIPPQVDDLLLDGGLSAPA